MVNIDDLKLPPHHLEAEKWVLSTVLIDNEVMYILEWMALESKDFYQKEHEYIFEALINLWANRKTIDVITLSDELGKADYLDVVGGTDYLYEIASFAITATVAHEYGKIVKEKSVLRNILSTCQKISGEVYDQDPVPVLLERIEKRIFDLTQVNLSDSLMHIKDVLNSRVEEYMELVDNPEKLEQGKVNTKYRDLDEVLGGFQPGQLIILAARPSMGKTAFALNCMINAAIQEKKTIAMFSLEMGNEQLVDRILCTVSGTPMHKITKWLLDDTDFANLGEAMEKLSSADLFLDDKWAVTLNELRSKLRRLKIEKGKLDMVVIDYLQLMSAWWSKFAWNRVQEVSELSRWLKELARELKTPIIALSQLSRAVENRPDKRPMLSDLRESWSIEQDADSVLMLYREDYYDPYTDKKWLANIFIRKNRNGPVGEVELQWVKEHMKFYNLEQGS